MRTEGLQQFSVGDRVRERDSPIQGEIVCVGDHSDEWRLRLENGCEIACLGVNLELVDNLSDLLRSARRMPPIG